MLNDTLTPVVKSVPLSSSASSLAPDIISWLSVDSSSALSVALAVGLAG